jgi:hypothetical protein
VQKQVIQVPDTYEGLVWAPDGSKFYVSGGTGDMVWVYARSTAAGWTVSASIPLNHSFFVPTSSPFFGLVLNGIGFEEETTTAGLGLSSDGSVLVAAKIYNDSISLINTATNTTTAEYDLRPYNTSGTPGVAGGEAPFTVAVKGTTTAYVSSIRNREVVAVKATRGFDWTAADRVPADLYNEIQWEGLKPGVPYPVQRSGLDLCHRLVTQAEIGR